jgi:hypothetical protein
MSRMASGEVQVMALVATIWGLNSRTFCSISGKPTSFVMAS